MSAVRPNAHRGATGLHAYLSLLHKYVAFAARRWWMILPLVLLGLGVGYWMNLQKPTLYVSVGRMMVSGRIALPEGAVYSEEVSNFYGTQIELMQSQEIRRRAMARVEGTYPELRASPVQLTVFQQRNTSFFVLSVTGSEPRFCQALLDAIMQEYVNFKREMRADSADTASSAVTEKLLRLDNELQTAQEELVAFQKKDNVVFLEEEGNSAGKRLIELRRRLAEMQSEYDLLKLLDIDQNIERQRQTQQGTDEKGVAAKPNAEGGVDSLLGPETEYLRAKQQIQLLQGRIDHFSRYLRPKHPKMLALTEEIAQQERMIELFRQQSVAKTKTRMAAIEVQMQSLATEIKEWEEKAVSLNQRIADYNRIKDKVDRFKSLSDKLLAAHQSVDVNKSLGQDTVTIMERASAAAESNIGLAKNLSFGGACGLMIGLLVVVVLALFDDRITTLIELQNAVPEEILAQIPREPLVGSYSVYDFEKKAPMFAQACKNLRSSLLFMSFDGPPPKSLLITSSVPEEGKSTISTSLALTLAAAGSRTLIIDADLRKGRVHQIFDADPSRGLAQILRREISVQEATLPTAHPNLFFIPRGRFASNASELFLRDVMDDMLREVYSDYDHIILDSAPVLAKEDTPSLAPKIDATLFVVRAGVATLRTCRSALDALHRRNVNVLGVIFNSVDRTSPGYYYYDGYGEADAEEGDSVPPPPATVRPRAAVGNNAPTV